MSDGTENESGKCKNKSQRGYESSFGFGLVSSSPASDCDGVSGNPGEQEYCYGSNKSFLTITEPFSFSPPQ